MIVGAMITGCADEDKEADKNMFVSELRSVSKLELSRMTITKMSTIDDLKQEDAEGLRQQIGAIVDKLKIGDRVAAYSYDTYLNAYMDLSSLTQDDIEVDEKNRTVTIYLPAVQTEYAGREMNFHEEHYRVTGMRSAINSEERAAIKENMNAHLRHEVESKDTFRKILISRAEAKARSFFSTLAESNGYKATIIIKES